MNTTIQQVRYLWFLLLTFGLQWAFVRAWVKEKTLWQRAPRPALIPRYNGGPRGKS